MEIYDILIHFFSFPLFFSSFLSRAHILYIMCRPFLLLDPSFIFSRPHSAVFQAVALRCPKTSKKVSPVLAYSEKVRTFALAFGDDPGADEKEIIERIRIQDEYEKEH